MIMDNQQSKEQLAEVGRLPFTEAVRTGNLLFISGQIGIGQPGVGVDASFGVQAVRVMENIGRVLESHGLQYGHLVNVTIYLTDMANYAETNKVYSRYFKDVFPARVCITVKELPMGAAIEISAVAFFNLI